MSNMVTEMGPLYELQHQQFTSQDKSSSSMNYKREVSGEGSEQNSGMDYKREAVLAGQ